MIRFHHQAFPDRLSLLLATAHRRFEDLGEYYWGELRPRLHGLARRLTRSQTATGIEQRRGLLLQNSELLSFAFFVFLIALTFLV
jgi:hypothetical protein